jgi:hypothetical protein
MIRAISAVVLLGLLPAHAGEFAVLPRDDAAFRERVGTFIRPGARVADAQALLEKDQFYCQHGRDAQGPLLWCGREDGTPMTAVKRRYEVVIRTAGPAVASVKTSTEQIGPRY